MEQSKQKASSKRKVCVGKVLPIILFISIGIIAEYILLSPLYKRYGTYNKNEADQIFFNIMLQRARGESRSNRRHFLVKKTIIKKLNYPQCDNTYWQNALHKTRVENKQIKRSSNELQIKANSTCAIPVKSHWKSLGRRINRNKAIEPTQVVKPTKGLSLYEVVRQFLFGDRINQSQVEKAQVSLVLLDHQKPYNKANVSDVFEIVEARSVIRYAKIYAFKVKLFVTTSLTTLVLTFFTAIGKLVSYLVQRKAVPSSSCSAVYDPIL